MQLRASVQELNQTYAARALEITNSIQTLQLQVDESILAEGGIPTPALVRLRELLNCRHFPLHFPLAPSPETDGPRNSPIQPRADGGTSCAENANRQSDLEVDDLAHEGDDEDEDLQSNGTGLSFIHVNGDDLAAPEHSMEVGNTVADLAVHQIRSGPIFSFVGDIGVNDGEKFPPGAKFTKTWRLRNDGGDPWPQPLELIHTGGGLECSTGVVPVPPALPGQFVDVSVILQVPASAHGIVASNWCLRAANSEGCRTSHLALWTEVSVQSELVDEPTGQGMAGPAPPVPQLQHANATTPSSVERLVMMGFGRTEAELACLVRPCVNKT